MSQEIKQKLIQLKSNISLVELKQLAIKLLPGKSLLRSIILSEPDFLPRQEGLIKVGFFVKLLYEELKHN